MKKSILLLMCCLGTAVFLHAQSNSPARLFMVQQDTTAVGDTFAVRIYADRFTALDSLSFSLYFKNDLVKWAGYTPSPETDANVTVQQQTAGANGNLLKINWKSQNTQGLTTTDSVALLELYFIGLKPTVGNEDIGLVNYPIPIRAFNVNQELIPISDNYLDLLETIAIYPTEAIHFMVEDTAVAPGQAFCRKIKVVSLDTPLISMQFSMGWDAAIMRLDSVRKINVPGLTLDNFNLLRLAEGKFSVAWFDVNLVGINLTPGASVFEVCFTALDSLGNSALQFTQSPTIIEFYGINETQLRFYGTPALISVSDNPFVHPGDTNLDGEVNHFDLLNIGLGYGNSGADRNNATLNWQEQPTGDWSQESPRSHVNYKHFDTDGNGLIELNDAKAIQTNWGLLWDNELNPPDPIDIREEGAPLYVKTNTIFPDNQPVTFDIILGEANNNAENVYGIAFSITYDEALSAADMSARFDNSWLGQVGKDLLVLQKNNPAAHRIDVALVRNDGQNRSGAGAIGQLHFTAPAYTGDAPAGTDTIAMLPFQVENVRAIDFAEIEQPTTPMETTAVVDVSTGINNPALAHQVKIFPNPASDILHIQTSALTIQRVEIFNAQGQLLQRYNNAATQIFTSHLPTGMYALRILTNEGFLVKPFVIK